jgi:uncharacterized membrane protein
MNQDSATMQSRIAWILGGAALGAVAMFLSDPDRGRRRRVLAADKIRSAVSRTGGAIDVASRDLGNRVYGLRAQASRMFTRDKSAADDRILIARVRQKIGRAVSHPHAIGVVAQQGRIILSGPVLAYEKEQLLDIVNGVPGVSEIEDNLDVHERPNGISSLQGSGRPASSAARESWTPALRAVALIGGGVLSITGLTRRTPASPLLMTAGAALMVRSISNMPFSSMAGLRTGRQAIELHKTIHLEASPDRVFDLWSNYENFPRFMSHVQEVRDLGGGRSHWVVSGPAGVPVEWNAEITDSRRPEVLAWRSEPGSTVQHGGTIHFEPDGSGTRVSVHMFYTPPAGVVGHAVASLFNADPKRQMDDDLMRMKAFVETGHPPHDAAQPGLQTTERLH